MSETLMRQWHMLRLVPRHPSKKGTSDIMNRLADEGFKITQRTIQRDLMAFSDIFPLVCDERSRPYGWSWMADGTVMDIPGMDSHTALAFHLADKHLEHLLPGETIRHLRSHFDKAKQVLDAIPTDSGAPAWSEKIRVVRRSQFLDPPVVMPEVQEQVYEAVLLNRRLKFTYCARHHGETKEYGVNPLGIVLKDGVIYLICTYWDFTDIRLMVLHRISKVEKIDIPLVRPVGFNLDDYIASGKLEFSDGGEIKLKAHISSDVAYHLNERPLHKDQCITDVSDGKKQLEVTVNDTSEIRWWMLGFGDQVTVLEPESLRAEFEDTSARMNRNYQSLNNG